MFRNPKSFAAGSRVWVAEAFDCVNCEVTKSQPQFGNDVVLDIYEMLPPNYGEWSGAKMFSMHDVISVFRLMEINPIIWDDIYMRLAHFHSELLDARSKEQAKAAKNKKPPMK